MTAAQIVGVLAFLFFIGVLAWLVKPRRKLDHPPLYSRDEAKYWGTPWE